MKNERKERKKNARNNWIKGKKDKKEDPKRKKVNIGENVWQKKEKIK